MSADHGPIDFGAMDLAANSEPRCPILLLLDTSRSMDGTPIEELNAGLRLFRDELNQDESTARCVEIAIVTFGPVNVETEFTTAHRFSPPRLVSGGATPMGEAVEHGLSMLRARKDAYQSNGIDYRSPLILLITDGSPTDNVSLARELIAAGERRREFKFYAIGVEGADFGGLKALSVRAPLRLKHLAFREFFSFLSSTLDLEAMVTNNDQVVLKYADSELPPVDQRRYTNVCFATASGQDALPPSLSLAAGKRYHVQIDIGALSPDSIVENPLPFDGKILSASDTGDWLDVIVDSSDFRVAGRKHRMFLPRTGPSWVCDCPLGQEHSCHLEARRRFLMVPVETPGMPGTGRLRLLIYFERNLLESHVVTAEITDEERPGQGARSAIDYTLTDGMRDIERLPPRDMNILAEKRDDGSHTILLNGDAARPISITLSEGQMTAAVKAARNSLQAIHIEQVGSDGAFTRATYRNRYGANNAKSPSDFRQDFARQAVLGWKLWVTLLGSDQDMRAALRDALRSRSTIQIARTARSNFAFPWGLVYDMPLEGDSSRKSFCPIFDEAGNWPHMPALDRCPHEDAHQFDTLCPFGFWGLKHFTEQPPSSPPGAQARLAIALGDEPSLIVAQSTSDLDMGLVEQHLDRIEQCLPQFAIKTCTSSVALRTALSRTGELVYFYCHGRTVTDPYSGQAIPSLQIGDRDMVEPADLTAWSDGLWHAGHWKSVSPLIFINGCHTTEITPESLVSFVDAFVGIHAAGVIGTEIAIYQQVAAEIAELFYAGFARGASVGEALRDIRWQLLAKGNLMGLAYTPYCSGSLRLDVANR